MASGEDNPKSDSDTDYSLTSVYLKEESLDVQPFLIWENRNIPRPKVSDPYKQWFPKKFLACYEGDHSLPSMDDSDDSSTWGIEELEVVNCVRTRTGSYRLFVRIWGTDCKYVIDLTPKVNCDTEEKMEKIQTLYQIHYLVKDHPFFVRLLLCFETMRSVCFVTEYIKLGDLAEYLIPRIRLPEDQARIFTAEISLALHFLHTNGVMYRNLCLSNVMVVADNWIKLNSFKNCTYAKTANERKGSIAYMAPEVFFQQPYDLASDLWSLGMVGFKLLSGPPRRGSASCEEITGNRPSTSRRGSFPIMRLFERGFLDFPSFVSNDAKKFIEELMQQEPKCRLGNGVFGFQEIKRHPFFHGINWKHLGKMGSLL